MNADSREPLNVRRWPRWPVGISLCAGLLILLVGAGCRMVQGVADVPGHAVRTVTPGKQDTNVVDPVALQQKLMRLADEFTMGMIVSIDALRRDGHPLERKEVLRLKIAFGTEITAMAAGANAFANLLDMTAFATVTRMAVEDRWQSEIYGESTQPLLEVCRTSETNIWQLADTILKPAQQDELRKTIAAWYQQNSFHGSMLAARAVGIASEMAETKPATPQESTSVFDLLHLNPLSGLDPTARQIAETRLFAERALFVVYRMPTLLRWQTELLTLNTTDLPTVQQLVTNSTQLTASVDRFATAAEKLPEQLSAERQQILQSLQSQEGELATLAGKLRETLLAGSQMSTSLNTTLTTFDAVMQRFGVGETNSSTASNTNAEPFRIQDYKDTAAQLAVTAGQLTELLVTFDRTIGSNNLAQLSAQVEPVMKRAQTGGKEVVDYAFWKGVLLLVLVLAAALIYRFLGPRLSSTASQSNTQTKSQ